MTIDSDAMGDTDLDGDVDGNDFGVFASCYNKAGHPPRTLGCGPNAVETIDIAESRHDNPYYFTGRWLNFIKEAAEQMSMRLYEFLPMELFNGEGFEAVKVSLDGPVKPATAEPTEKTGKQKADAGQKRPDPSLDTKRKVDAGDREAFKDFGDFDVLLLAEFGSTTAEPLLFAMFAACTNGTNHPPAEHPDCTEERAAVFDFDSDGDIVSVR